MRPIIGAEITFGPDNRQVVLLVGSDTGYRNLCNIISARKRKEIITIDPGSADSFRGLVLLTDCGLIMKRCRAFGVNVAADLGSRPTERGSRLREQAAALGIPSVATPDCDLADHGQKDLYRLLRAIDGGTTRCFEESKHDDVNALEHPDAYAQRFAVWPDVLRATEAVAEQCGFTGPSTELLMPTWRQGKGEAAGPVLCREAFAGARRRYGVRLPQEVIVRLEHELSVIADMGFSSYFLVVRDIVLPLQQDGSRKERRICGRGSGAASLVAYCLGITNVCPIRYNLYFERFLNPGRSDPPDIDVDFAWDERDEVLNEVLGGFGNRAAMVCNHVCFKPRSVKRHGHTGCPGMRFPV
jgi:DNA polymerase-3 subunit alpha/error-prone DNA polymerase